MTELLRRTTTVLSNGILDVELTPPGTGYSGARYDWSSFITGITYHGTHQFLGVESREPDEGSGGQGLCSEFGKCSPLGYHEASVGEDFVKIGVGLVKRLHGGEYDFFEPAPVTPLDWTVNHTSTSLSMACHQAMCQGFAYTLSKRVSLNLATLNIEYELCNTGEKPIVTDEYCHNFLSINDMAIGRNYRMRTNVSLDPARVASPLSYCNGAIDFVAEVAEPFYTESKFPHPHAIHNGQWQVFHDVLGLGIKESLSAPLGQFSLYGTPSVLCPELYVSIDLVPGEKVTWQRSWEILTNK